MQHSFGMDLECRILAEPKKNGTPPKLAQNQDA